MLSAANGIPHAGQARYDDDMSSPAFARGGMTVLSDDVGATLLEKGAPQTPSQNFCILNRRGASATSHYGKMLDQRWLLVAEAPLRVKAQRGLTEVLGPAFPQKW